MATKTMILRPVAVDSPNETLVSFVPSTTDISSAYSLINEVYADDDSGYIILSAGGKINSYFNYKRPSNMSNITGVSVKIRCKLETEKSMRTLNSTMTILSEFSSLNITGITNEYIDYELIFSNSDIDLIINELNSIEEKRILLETLTPSETKQAPIRITQIYIEIIYEALSDIYQKIDGTWIILENSKCYKFSNNSWKLLTNIDFYNGQKYLLQFY